MVLRVKKIPLFVKNWMLPVGIFNVIKYRVRVLESYVKYRRILSKNIELKNIHSGERCFIVGNAPSISKIEIEKLKDEFVFSISNGYHHPKYSYFKPNYHLLPALTYTSIKGGMNDEAAVRWFKEMDKEIGSAKLILSVKQIDLVGKYSLFSRRDVYYMDTSAKDYHDIDLTKTIGEIWSAPQIAIQVAMYMGFKEIYLLGVDHNSICSHKYDYFFDAQRVMKFKDASVDENRNIVDSLRERFLVHEKLFKVYELLANAAIFKRVKIINLSEESMVDCFERDSFDKVVK